MAMVEINRWAKKNRNSRQKPGRVEAENFGLTPVFLHCEHRKAVH